jgi:hypothetical protein
MKVVDINTHILCCESSQCFVDFEKMHADLGRLELLLDCESCWTGVKQHQFRPPAVGVDLRRC